MRSRSNSSSDGKIIRPSAKYTGPEDLDFVLVAPARLVGQAVINFAYME